MPSRPDLRDIASHVREAFTIDYVIIQHQHFPGVERALPESMHAALHLTAVR